MSDIMNQIQCQEQEFNTGTPKCFIDPKKIKSVIATDVNYVIAAAYRTDQATLLAKLQADSIADRGVRIYPIHGINEITDNSEDPVTETSGYGEEEITRDGKYKHQFQFWGGALCLLRQLRKMNGKTYRFIYVDDDDKLLGTDIGGDFAGYLSYFYALPYKLNDGSNKTKYLFKIHPTYASELNDTPAIIDLSVNFESNVKGILNATVEVLLSTETYADCKVTLDCGATDLYDLYDDELADVTLWKPKNSAGAAVTPSAVAKQAATKSWRVTGAFTAGTYTIELGTPAALAAEGIGLAPANGIETPVATTFITTS